MPTYEWVCEKGHYFERTMSMREYDAKQQCECGAAGKRIISVAPFAKIQGECNYTSPIDDRPITSWAQRREDLARSGCRPYDPEMKTDAERHRKHEQDKLEKSIDETVERTFEAMPAKKKEKLANELLGGADAAPTRGTAVKPNIKTEIQHGR